MNSLAPRANLMCLLLLLGSFISLDVFAQDSLDQILLRLKIKQTSQFDYTEIRELKLLASPWQGSGELFLSSENIVVTQHVPKEIVLLISATNVRYIDTQLNIHKLKKLENPYEIPQIGLFLDLLYAHHTQTSLREKYEIQFQSNENNWQLHLTPVEQNGIKQMKVQGEVGSVANQLLIIFEDGDTTTWRFLLTAQGELAEKNMQAVSKQALENHAKNNNVDSHILLK